MVRDTVLANGLHVIAVRSPSAPYATIKVVVRTGAFSQLAEGDEGVPHLLEHMLFKSSEEWGKSFGTYTAELDASSNGTTSDEAVTYYVTLPSKNLAKGVRLMWDLVRDPDFTKEALDSERKVVSGELQRKVSDPQYLLISNSDRVFWGEGWSRKNPGGNLLAIMGATPQRLDGFYKRFYIPNNAALVVTGDVNHAEVFDLASKTFKGWKRGEDPYAKTPIPPMPALTSTQRHVIEANVSDVTFLIRWRGPSVTTDPKATHAADLFASLVNHPLSGMQQRLVDAGLFQSVSLGYRTQSHVGPIELYARTTPEKIAAAGAALQAELNRFGAADYFSEDEVVIAKKQIQVGNAFALESGSSLADPVGDLWSSAGLEYYLGYVDNLLAQRPEDVREFVGKYITGKPLVVSVLVSNATRQKAGAALDNVIAKLGTP
jgi:zinc protease